MEEERKNIKYILIILLLPWVILSFLISMTSEHLHGPLAILTMVCIYGFPIISILTYKLSFKLYENNKKYFARCLIWFPVWFPTLLIILE